MLNTVKGPLDFESVGLPKEQLLQEFPLGEKIIVAVALFTGSVRSALLEEATATAVLSWL